MHTKTKDKRCEQFLYNFRTYIYAIMLNRPLLDEIYVTPLAILYEVEPVNPFSIIQFSRPSPRHTVGLKNLKKEYKSLKRFVVPRFGFGVLGTNE